MSYAWQTFESVILTLMGEGSQRTRLLKACVDDRLLELKVKEIPSEIRGYYEKLLAVLLRHSSDKEGITRALDATSDEQITAMIKLIHDIHDVLVQYQPLPIKANANQDDAFNNLHG